MKPSKVVFLSVIAAAIVAAPFVEFNNSSQVPQTSRSIASISEFSLPEKAGLLIVPRITAIIKVRQMAKENREQLQSFEKAEAEYFELIDELNEAKAGLKEELTASNLTNEEIKEQLKIVEKEFDKAKQELELLAKKLNKQNEYIADLEYKSCLQNEKISSLEDDLKAQIQATEDALARLKKDDDAQDQKNKREQEQREMFDNLMASFKTMIKSQLNFQSSYQSMFNVPQFQYPQAYNPFMMQNLMFNQNAMNASMMGGYSNNQAFGVGFLNNSFLGNLDLDSYYGINNNDQKAKDNSQFQIPMSRFEIFPELGRAPATGQNNFYPMPQNGPSLFGPQQPIQSDFIRLN